MKPLCDVNNGTYGCHYTLGHKGMHSCTFTSEGVRKLASWETKCSEVLTRKLVKKDFLLRA